MLLYSINIKAGQYKSGIERDREIFKEAEISKKVFGDIPTEPGFDLYDFCPYNKLHVVIINLRTRSTDYTPEIALSATVNSYSD